MNVYLYDFFKSEAIGGNLEMIKYLIKDHRITEGFISSAIDYAAKNNRTEIVKFLLTDMRCDPNRGLLSAISWNNDESFNELINDDRITSKTKSTIVLNIMPYKKINKSIVKRLLQESCIISNINIQRRYSKQIKELINEQHLFMNINVPQELIEVILDYCYYMILD
jgi:hypothetical protein